MAPYVWIVLVACLVVQQLKAAISDPTATSFSCDGKPVGDYPDPLELCSKNYISCTHDGKAILRQCPEGLYFDRKVGVCNWQHSVAECQQQTDSSLLCPSDGNFALDISQPCSRLYRRCIAGRAEQLYCNKDEVFNATLARCLTASGPCAFCQPRLRGRYPVGDGCHNEYYECDDNFGPTLIETCAKPYAFSPHTQLCAPEKDVPECQDPPLETLPPKVPTIVEQQPSYPSTPATVFITQPPAPVWHRNTEVQQTRCTKSTYVDRCSGQYDACDLPEGRTVRRHCPGEMVFYEPYGGCVTKGQSPECSMSAELYATHCQTRPNALLAKSLCSSEYIKCMGATPLRQWCQPDQVFDEPGQSCVNINQRPVCLASVDRQGRRLDNTDRRLAMVQCSGADRTARRRRPVERCSNVFLQCDSSQGDQLHRCLPDALVYDQLYDRCVPTDLSNECSQGGVFYPLQQRQRSKRFAARADGSFFNPGLFGGARSSPVRLTEFGLRKETNIRMEVGGQVMQQQQPSAAAMVANFDGLDFDDGSSSPAPAGMPLMGHHAGALIEQPLQPIAAGQQQWVMDSSNSPFGAVQADGFCSRQPDGVYSLGSCRQEYAVCRDKRELRLSCPDNRVFDPKSMECVQPSDKICTKRSTGDQPELLRLVCLNKPNGVYAMASCSRFYYTCFNGQYRLLQCQFGQVFSPTERKCTTSDKAGCVAPAEASVPVDNYAGTSVPQFCQGSFESWTDCASACGQPTCGGQTAAVACGAPCTPGCVCRPGYVRLAPQSRMCVPQEACLQYSLTKSSVQQTFCDNRPDGVYPYPGKSCNAEYVKCTAGVMAELYCAKGQLFDAGKGMCISQQSCQQAPVPSASGLDSYFCRGKPTGAYNLPGKTCFNLYYTCAAGVVTFGKCPPGQVFDLHTGCVSPSMCDDGPADPTDLYCSGRSDGLYTFNGYQCFPVYYACKRGRVIFNICHGFNQDLVFSGQGCVPRETCQATTNVAAALLPVRYTSPLNDSRQFDPSFCNNQPDGAYPIVECTAPYLVCVNSVTTIHYCFTGEVFAKVNLPSGAVYQCAQPRYTLCEPHYATTGQPPAARSVATAATVGNVLCKADDANGKLHPLSNDRCEQHYINCTQQEFLMEQCPGKLVFNARDQRCQADYTCLSQPPPDYRKLCGDKSNGFYTFTLCSAYYLYCQKGVGWVQACLNPSWAFNGQSLQCAPREQVPGCQMRLAVANVGLSAARLVAPGDLSPLDVRCQTLGDGGYEISACQSDYIVCNMGFGDVRSCSKGTVFSAQHQRCLQTDQLDVCQTQTGDSLCRAKTDGAYPFEPCSPRMYVCWKQFSYVQQCTTGQIFHSRLQACVNANTVPACLAGSKEPVVPCSAVGRWAFGACQSSFNLCVPEGRLVAVHCGQGELFDRRLERCVRGDLCEVAAVATVQQVPPVKTVHKPTVTALRLPAKPAPVQPKQTVATVQQLLPSSNTSPPVDLFCLDQPDGFYRHPVDCAMFIQCFRRRTFTLHCATGLVFNPKINVCDFARNVPDCNLDSQDRLQQAWQADQLNPEQRTAWQLCTAAEHGTFVRDPTDCRRYYRCVHGKAYKFDCPGDLVFNARLNVCDYVTNVPDCPVVVNYK